MAASLVGYVCYLNYYVKGKKKDNINLLVMQLISPYLTIRDFGMLDIACSSKCTRAYFLRNIVAYYYRMKSHEDEPEPYDESYLFWLTNRSVPLQHLHIRKLVDNYAMKSVANTCCNLETLVVDLDEGKIKSGKYIINSCLATIIQESKFLKDFTLKFWYSRTTGDLEIVGHVEEVVDESLQSIATNCKELKSLTLHIDCYYNYMHHTYYHIDYSSLLVGIAENCVH